MSSNSTESGSHDDSDRTPVQQGLDHARRAMNAGVKLSRKHGPVVARKTAKGLKKAGTKIRDSEHTRKLAKTGKKAGQAAGRAGKKAGTAVKKKVEKHPWLAKAVERVSDTTTRVTKATREHLVEKRYFEKSLKTLEEQVRRYPAIENAWHQTRHAFSMSPASTAKTPTTKKKPTRKKAATTKKTTAKKAGTKKTATKKKTTSKKKKTNRAA